METTRKQVDDLLTKIEKVTTLEEYAEVYKPFAEKIGIETLALVGKKKDGSIFCFSPTGCEKLELLGILDVGKEIVMNKFRKAE